MDRLVKKESGLWSLVRGSIGEERIWVVGAWFLDWPVKKGSVKNEKERDRLGSF